MYIRKAIEILQRDYPEDKEQDDAIKFAVVALNTISHIGDNFRKISFQEATEYEDGYNKALSDILSYFIAEIGNNL